MGGLNGVHFTYVRDGRPSGEAYVEFDCEEEVNKALEKDKHHMGKRYIDGIFLDIFFFLIKTFMT